MTPVQAVTAYIQGTHGSLPELDRAAVSSLLSDSLLLTNEGESHEKDELMGIFEGWGAIVQGHSCVRIHAVAQAEKSVVLAHWETDYDVKEGSVWYGTDVDISGIQVRGFVVFACFYFDLEGKICRIVQRSDTVVKTLGIEQKVVESRARLLAAGT